RLTERSQKFVTLVRKCRQLDVAAADLAQRMCVRTRTDRLVVGARPFDGALVQRGVVQASIEALDGVDEITDRLQDATPAALAVREWMRHVHDAALGTD